MPYEYEDSFNETIQGKAEEKRSMPSAHENTPPSETEPALGKAARKPSGEPKRFKQAIYLLPGVAVAVLVGVSIGGYQPLTFDPALYQAAASVPARAQALEIIDPEETSVRTTGRTYDGSLDEEAFDVPAEGLKDGVYTASAYGYKSDIEVQVTISQGKIESIVIASQADDAEYFNRALGVIPAILESQSTAVDAVSGATFSSKGILAAVKKCLIQAAIGADDAASADTDASEGNSDKPSAPSIEIPRDPSTDPSEDQDSQKLLSGVYTSFVYCCDEANPSAFRPYYLALTVRVVDGAVVEISDVHGSSTGLEGDAALEEYDTKNDLYLDWAAWGRTIRSEHITYVGVADQIEQRGYQRVSSFDAVSGATYSSVAIARAYNAALDMAHRAYVQARLDGSEPDSRPEPGGEQPPTQPEQPQPGQPEQQPEHPGQPEQPQLGEQPEQPPAQQPEQPGEDSQPGAESGLDAALKPQPDSEEESQPGTELQPGSQPQLKGEQEQKPKKEQGERR